ncbi:hypothetical protein ACT3SP_13890 [Brachybacterium sp. AOP43-C2-M15]|uniref:hypothetical protein n=1 Tax=Brachybacterium sp. AOP43-C2-M15 TaxID=3457661 RepID=UPI004033736B
MQQGGEHPHQAQSAEQTGEGAHEVEPGRERVHQLQEHDGHRADPRDPGEQQAGPRRVLEPAGQARLRRGEAQQEQARDQGEPAAQRADDGEQRSGDAGDHRAPTGGHEGGRQEHHDPRDRIGEQRLPRLQQLVERAQHAQGEQAAQQHRTGAGGAGLGRGQQHPETDPEQQREDREEALLDEQLLEHVGERGLPVGPGHEHAHDGGDVREQDPGQGDAADHVEAEQAGAGRRTGGRCRGRGGRRGGNGGRGRRRGRRGGR